MTVAMTVLGLVDVQPRHGYDVRRTYDVHFAGERPLKPGQLYATLQRLERDQLIKATEVSRDAGPDRTVFAVTPRGSQQVVDWLATPEPDVAYQQSVVFAKVLLALMSGRSAPNVLDTQRRSHLDRMRAWTARRQHAESIENAVSADFVLFHLDADLRWLDATSARLDQLSKEVGR